MKTKTVFFTLLVLLTASTFGQGLSINGQDTKKSKAILTTPEQQADLMFHNKPIDGIASYDKITPEYYAKRVDVFAKIALDRTMAQMQTINKFTNGGLLNANGKILPLTAADAEAVWRAKVKRMKVNSSDKFGFVSVDNHLDGSIDTVYRQFYDGEECFVMDLREEGFGMFIMGSALCGNPGSDNELLFALQDDPQGDLDDNQEFETGDPKKSLRNNKESLTDKERELVDNNQKDDELKTYKNKTGQGTVIIFKPVIITKSGDVTGGEVTTGAVNVGSGSGSGSESGRKKVYVADDEESYETYSPNAIHRTQSGGSSSTRCLDCGNNNTNYVTANGRPKSSGAEIVTAVATSAHLAYDIVTDIFAPGGRWNGRGRGVVGNGGTTLPNTNTNTNTNTGAGEMGYGIPPM